jgi:hypothetical protein
LQRQFSSVFLVKVALKGILMEESMLENHTVLVMSDDDWMSAVATDFFWIAVSLCRSLHKGGRTKLVFDPVSSVLIPRRWLSAPRLPTLKAFCALRRFEPELLIGGRNIGFNEIEILKS